MIDDIDMTKKDMIDRATACKYCLSVGKDCFGHEIYVKCNRDLPDVVYIRGKYDTPTYVVTPDECYDCDWFEREAD